MQSSFHRHLYGCPWAILPEKHQELCIDAKAVDVIESDDYPSTEAGLLVFDGIAHIYIYGVMVPAASPLECEYFGLCSVARIREQVIEAEARSDVGAVMFVMDTPGGYTQGIPQLADQMASMKKPSVVYVEGGMNSAGYWVGCSQTVYADVLASVGSIGCYLAMYDDSKRYEMAGLRTILVTTGDHKGAGVPGTTLTEEQVQHYADEVVGVVGQKFFNHVTDQRGLDESVMDGRSWLAEKALELGLIDRVGSREDAYAELTAMLTTRSYL